MRPSVPAAGADPLAVPADPDAGVADRFVTDVVRHAAGVLTELPQLPTDDRWIERARLHGVLLPVLAALRASGQSPPASTDRVRVRRAATALSRHDDLRGLQVLFDRLGLVWALLKGPVLDQVVYAKSGTRESSDIDILVHPRDLGRVVRALEAAGWVRLGADWTQRTWRSGAEVPMRTPLGTTVDVHWSLVNRPEMRRAFDLSSSDLLANRVERDINGMALPSLADLDLALHVMLHSCLDGCGRLRAMLDVQQCAGWLVSRGHSPHDLARRADELRLSSPSWTVLALTAETVDGQLVRWRDAIARPSWWSRAVIRRSIAPGQSPLVDGSTRRLVRYVGPSTTSSFRASGSYVVQRVLRLLRADRSQLGTDALGPDPAFDRYVDSVVSADLR